MIALACAITEHDVAVIEGLLAAIATLCFFIWTWVVFK